MFFPLLDCLWVETRGRGTPAGAEEVLLLDFLSWLSNSFLLAAVSSTSGTKVASRARGSSKTTSPRSGHSPRSPASSDQSLWPRHAEGTHADEDEDEHQDESLKWKKKISKVKKSIFLSPLNFLRPLNLRYSTIYDT